jgi:Na+-driven multidrug efflux pump
MMVSSIDKDIMITIMRLAFPVMVAMVTLTAVGMMPPTKNQVNI